MANDGIRGFGYGATGARAIEMMGLGAVLIAATLLGACNDYDSVNRETKVSEVTAKAEIEGTAPKVELDSSLVALIDDAIGRVAEEPTANVSDLVKQIEETIGDYPDTRNAEQIQAEYETLMGRFDVVISTTRTPEARAPLGQLKKATNQAFERALAEEYKRGGDDAEREGQQREAELAAEAKAQEEALAAQAEAIVDEATKKADETTAPAGE